MERLYVFVINNQIWLTLLFGLGLLWYLIQTVSRQRTFSRSYFHMERDRAISDRNIAFFYVLICSLVLIGVYHVNTNIQPTLPERLFQTATPQPDLLATALATPVAVQFTPRSAFPTPTPIMVATATLRNPGLVPREQLVTPTPPPLDVEALTEGCSEDVVINEPISGTTVGGGMSIFGRAMNPNFGSYTLDMRGDFTQGSWQSLIGDPANTPVANGFLGSANLEVWTAGIYQLRLTVFDVDAVEVGSCTIQIGIQN